VIQSSSQSGRTFPWWEPLFSGNEGERIATVLASGMVNDGELTREFEKKVAELCNIPFAVAVTNCTTALSISLLSVGVEPGDDVVVPAMTYVATANAARLIGAHVVFADVRDDAGIDPVAVEKAITSRTKAIIPVHVSGRPAPIDDILSIAKQRGIAVIEDAAEALGSFHRDTALGSFGDAGCFSFSPMKTVTTGQGGMMITRRKDLHDRMRELKDQGRPHGGTGGNDEHPSFGINAKLTNVQAAIGLAQWETLNDRLDHQRMITRVYEEELKDVRGIRIGAFDLDDGVVPQWIDIQSEHRDSLYDFLEARSMHCRKFWFPVPSQKPYGGDASAFPNALRISKQAMWLPSALALQEADIREVAACIKEWAKTNV
jgi:perosamine synthetase